MRMIFVFIWIGFQDSGLHGFDIFLVSSVVLCEIPLYLCVKKNYTENHGEGTESHGEKKQSSHFVSNHVKLSNKSNKLSSRPGEFHPQPLTEPYLIVSHHTALHNNLTVTSHIPNVRTSLDMIYLPV